MAKGAALNSGGGRQRRVQDTNQIPAERRWWALGAVLISMFFSSLNQTSVSTAMPTIIADLNGFTLYAWVFTGYILAAAITVPLYGRLSDTFGRKPFYIFGLIVFLIGSFLCGVAQNITWLIVARAVQGIGGGAMMSMPRATIGDIFNPRERGRWMGLIMGVFGLASLVGPALGGWITDHWGWHWVFFINAPVAVVALGMVLYALPTVRTDKAHHVDWSGSLLLACGLLPMLFAFTWGGSTYAWGSWQEVSLFVASAVILAGFVFNERKVPEPVIQMSMFGNRTFSSTIMISLFIMMAMFSANMFLPLFVQGVMGVSAQSAGFILTPMMLSFVVGSIVAGQLLTRTGKYKVLSLVSGVSLMIGAFFLAQLDIDATWGEVVRDMIFLGLGIGSLMSIMGTIVQNLFPYKMMGAVNATQQAANTLAGAIAAPVFGTVMATRFAAHLPAVLPDSLKQTLAQLPPEQQAVFANPQELTSAGAQEALKAKFAAFGAQGEQLYHSFITAVHQALTFAITELYHVAFVFAILAFLAVFFVREIPLKRDEFFAKPDEGAAEAPAAAPAELRAGDVRGLREDRSNA